MSAFNWSAIAFILAAIGLVVFMLVVPRLLGGRSQGSQKEEVFEAGVVGSGNARIRLSAKFYLVAIFFVIFDLEALYLYAYAVSVREAGWLGFAAAGQVKYPRSHPVKSMSQTILRPIVVIYKTSIILIPRVTLLLWILRRLLSRTKLNVNSS